MSRRATAVGTMLNCEDGEAIVVPGPDASVLEWLTEMVSEGYGGEVAKWSADNPVLVAEAEKLKIETWRSCTKAWRESEGVDEDRDGWWAPDGDGKRAIYVLWWDGSIYDLGERAEAAEEAMKANA